MTVLIISSLPDVHAQAVMSALAARGATTELLDLSEFPTQLSLSMEYSGARRRFSLRRNGGGTLDFGAVGAVWWRRPQPFRAHDGIDGEGRRFAFSEAATAFQGLYQSLDALWINEPSRDSVASHKPYQLTLAQEIGLEIPPTLMTNDPEAARAFWRAHEGEVIHKQFIALPETWRETRRVRDSDEEAADAIVHAPVIFQRHVPAVADLRVIAVGQQLFAASTDVSKSGYPQDVRMNIDARYAAHDLPRDIKTRLHALMERLGLIYGAIDLRLTPDGRYVFLEINPAGQFLYIEKDTDQPIAEAIALQLMNGRNGAENGGRWAADQPTQ